MSTDKITIGVTQENRAFLDEVIAKQLFNDQLDAAKLGLSLAIRAGVEIGEASGVATTWNTGIFDKAGHLKSVLTALFPEAKAPYRLAEHLMNRGLDLLREHLATNPDMDIAKVQESIAAWKL